MGAANAVAQGSRPSGDPVIEFRDVGMSFGHRMPFPTRRKRVLREVSLRLEKGEALCLLGPSGCGKTTMVNLVMGSLIPTEGEVLVMGERAPYPTARSRIGYLPQDEALYEDLTAEENLRFFGALAGMPAARRAERIEELLAFTRLADDRRRLVGAFSGGMKRRLSLAVALLHEPDLLILDEPTVGLDPAHRQRIWQALEELRRAGRSLLVTTHVMDEAHRCGRVALLREGRIIADASPERILRDTATESLEQAFLALERGAGHE